MGRRIGQDLQALALRSQGNPNGWTFVVSVVGAPSGRSRQRPRSASHAWALVRPSSQHSYSVSPTN
jgi:hypothetical protein